VCQGRRYATLRPEAGKPLDSAITVGELVAFMVTFVILAGLGRLTGSIAARKGGNYMGWSYYGLVLPIIALPHALLKKASARQPA